MAKINIDLLKKVKEEYSKEQVISVDIFGETVDIQLKNFLDSEQKLAMINDFMKIAGEQLNKTEISMWSFWCVIKALTDIEVPEEVSEQLEMFNYLIDLGVIEEIVKNLAPGLFEDMMVFLALTLGRVNEIMANPEEVEALKAIEEITAE